MELLDRKENKEEDIIMSINKHENILKLKFNFKPLVRNYECIILELNVTNISDQDMIILPSNMLCDVIAEYFDVIEVNQISHYKESINHYFTVNKLSNNILNKDSISLDNIIPSKSNKSIYIWFSNSILSQVSIPDSIISTGILFQIDKTRIVKRGDYRNLTIENAKLKLYYDSGEKTNKFYNWEKINENVTKDNHTEYYTITIKNISNINCIAILLENYQQFHYNNIKLNQQLIDKFALYRNNILFIDCIDKNLYNNILSFDIYIYKISTIYISINTLNITLKIILYRTQNVV